MGNTETKYQITKTVRFKLEAVNTQAIESKFNLKQANEDALKATYNSDEDEDSLDRIMLKNFVDYLQNTILHKAKNLLYYKKEGQFVYDDDDNILFNKSNSVRYDFMLAFLKKDVYANDRLLSEKKKFYKISTIDFLKEKIVECLNNIEAIKNDLETISNRKDEQKKRNSDVSFFLNKLTRRNNYIFFKNLIFALDEKSVTPFQANNIADLKKDIEKFDADLKTITNFFLPTQSQGLQVALGSLNYFVMGRTPRLNSEDETEDEYSMVSEMRKANENNNSTIYQLWQNGFALKIRSFNYAKSWKDVVDFAQKSIDYFKNINQFSKVTALEKFQKEAEKADKNDLTFINFGAYDSVLSLEVSKDIIIKLFESNPEKAKDFILTESSQICNKYQEIFSDVFVKKIYKLFAKSDKIKLSDVLMALSLKESYNFIKFWKGELKSAFYEKVEKYFTTDDPESAYNNLFNDILYYMEDDDMDTFLDHTEYMRGYVKIKNAINAYHSKETTNKNEIINNIRGVFGWVYPKRDVKKFISNKNNLNVCDKDIEREAKERNIVLVGDKQHPAKAKTFNSLCKLYKCFAVAYGKNKALINAIKKESNTALQLNYWSIICEIANEKYLYLIPRSENNDIKKAHDKICSDLTQDKKSEGDNRIVYFESLTLRALRKLCFNRINDNSFRKSLSSVSLPECEHLDIETKKPFSDSEIINMYVNVLQDDTSSIAEQLKQYNLDLQALKRCANLKEFETKLNLYCYNTTSFYTKNIDDFFNTNGISYYKFKICPHKTKSAKTSYEKIWQQFWDETKVTNYITRLNPEIKVFRREAKEDIGIKSRFSDVQYTVAFTFTDNADAEVVDYSFVRNQTTERKKYNDFDKNKESIIKHIAGFNADLLSKYHTRSASFALGIDVGTNEGKAYLTTCNPEGKPNLFNILVTNEAERGCKYIDKNGIERKFMLNPSYFLNKDVFNKYFPSYDFENIVKKHFSVKSVSSIDLTTVKVFSIDDAVVNVLNPDHKYEHIKKGKVLVLDGDFVTPLNLKRHSAQVEMAEKIDISRNFNLSIINRRDTDGKTRFYLAKDGAPEGNAIYTFMQKYSCVADVDTISRELNACLN